MKIDRRGREYCYWPVTAAPEDVELEVTFDRIAGWHPLERVGATFRALVAGPDAPADQPTAIVLPMGVNLATMRAPDNPEIVIRPAGSIDIY